MLSTKRLVVLFFANLLGFFGCDGQSVGIVDRDASASVGSNQVALIQNASLLRDANADSESPSKVLCRWLQPQIGETAQTVWVYNGDTFGIALFEGEPPSFATLAYFDAPEIDQPFGKEAANRLAELLSSERISAGPATKEEADQQAFLRNKGVIKSTGPLTVFGRPSWDLVLQRNAPISVAEVMAEEGLGWWIDSKHHAGRMAMLRAIEAKRGIWSRAMPIAPWVWRELSEGQRQSLR